MGLTERHWFENEEPELTDRQLEDAVSIQDRVYRRGYHKGYSDGAKEQEEKINNYKETIENLLQQLQDISKYMTPIGMVSDVRAYIEGRAQPEIIRCYACKHGEKANDVYLCGKARGFGIAHNPAWFCADGERKD